MRLSLTRLFAVTLVGLIILLSVLFWLVFTGSKKSILQISERMRDTASQEIADRVSEFLFQADSALDGVASQIRHKAIDPRSESAVEAALFTQLLAHDSLDQITLTFARSKGFDGDGAMILEADGREQISVYRATDGGAEGELPIVTRRVCVGDDGKSFAEEFRRRPPRGTFDAVPFVRAPGSVPDPTDHLTFQTPTRRVNYGDALWSDLHWSQRDAQLPPAQRRVVVTVQRTIEDGDSHFVGVLQVGLLTRQLDRIAQLKLNTNDPQDPHRIFLCDSVGGLISRVTPTDHIEKIGDDLRFVSSQLPREVAMALKQPELKTVISKLATWSGRIEVDGKSYLLTFRPLARTQDWIVGIVVPESYYLGQLVKVRNRLLVGSLIVMLCILLGGFMTLRLVRHGFQRITEQTSRMQRFAFTPFPPQANLEEVRQVLMQIESAKTALRAMGKYVPIDLVRQLYERNAEPMLGGELMDLTVMFTDIYGFTDFAEKLDGNQLAAALGSYLEVMTEAIQKHNGVIDKFIGDAVMALWNAPRAVANHPASACAAALACVEGTAALFKSPQWKGLPPLVTRFGIHTDRVTVGHFGAPSRMNFTAVGDGVNTAARLEGLNKHYQTTLLVTGSVYEQARDRFRFRHLDRVAVVGKSLTIEVYELLCRAGEADARDAMATDYTAALEAYFTRCFADALKGFERHPEDGPSAVMAARCREYLQSPPPENWDGTHAWGMK